MQEKVSIRVYGVHRKNRHSGSPYGITRQAVMPISDPRDRFFLSTPYTHERYLYSQLDLNKSENFDLLTENPP